VSEHQRRFLLTMWEGGGTIPPQLGVARRLLERGHLVHVLGDPTIEQRAAALGCTFSAWRRAPHRTSLDPAQDLFRDWEVSNPLAVLRNFRDGFMAGPAGDFAADTLEAVAAVEPDAAAGRRDDARRDGRRAGRTAAGGRAHPQHLDDPDPGRAGGRARVRAGEDGVGRTRDGVMRAVANRNALMVYWDHDASLVPSVEDLGGLTP
jgi:hypothetical protein